jgi:hypothetical protein
MPDYGKLRDAAAVTLPGGWKSFAGQADDPFFLDLRVFDLLYGGNLSEVGQDTLAGYNVNTIALQVPFKDVALRGDAKRNPVIGVWTTTDRKRVRVTDGSDDRSAPDATESGDQNRRRVQVSRLGNPLVNEVVVPAGLKDAFNASTPAQDGQNATLVKRVTEPEVPKLIQAIYGVPAPATPRNDLVEIFLTGITTKANGPVKADLNSQLNNADVAADRFVPSEQLRLNLSVPVNRNPNRLGVLAKDLQGFPNGRRLGDDVVDIEVQALEGAAQTGQIVDALKDGDKVNANDNAFSGTFPYVALPNLGAVNGGRRAGNAMVPETAPSTTPAGFATGSSKTALTVATVATGLASILTLVVLLMVGWWRRRNRITGDTTVSIS